MFSPKKNLPKKNPNATLAGGLPRRDTALPDQTIDYQERMEELPLITAPPESPEFVKQLKAIFQQMVNTCGLAARSAREQYRNIVAALDLKFGRGRLPTFEARTPRERKQHERERKNAFDWLSFFPIIAHAPYLIIEASPEDKVPSFDLQHARTIIGYELQRMMDAHCRTYPDQKHFIEQSEPGLRYETEKNGTAILVLEYPDDRVCHIAPMYTTPPTSESVLAGRGFGSLNRGLFLAEAPKGKGKVVSGWRQTGYRTNTAEREASGVDEDFSGYTDEFATEDDHEGEDSGSVNPEGFGNRPRTEDELDEQIKNSEFEAINEKYRDNEGKPEAETGVLKCRICGEVLEGDDDDDTLLFKHLEERHLDEYQRICRKMEEQFDKAREVKKKHERRQLEKQKHCLNDHDGMFARQLEAHGPGAYFCKCDVPLCKGTHVKQVEEVLAERAAYRSTLSSQEQLDASKRKQAPIYCKYCRQPSW